MRMQPMRLRKFSLAALLVSMPASTKDCNLTSLTITSNSASVGNVIVTLGNADDAQQPTAWLGPVTISTDGQPACTASESVSIVEKPVLLGPDILFVPTYSGSERIMYALDTKTCRIVWKSHIFYGDSSYTHGALTLGNHRVILNKKCHPAT
jgi:hypothetical protein